MKLDDDGMLALQIALDLDVSAMEKIKTPIMEKLDLGGKGVMTRKAWKIIPGLCEDGQPQRVGSSLPSPPPRWKLNQRDTRPRRRNNLR